MNAGHSEQELAFPSESLQRVPLSAILAAMRMCFGRACEQDSWNGEIDLMKECGVYNLYVQVSGGGGNVERAVDVSPNEMEFEVERGDTRFSGAFGR